MCYFVLLLLRLCFAYFVCGVVEFFETVYYFSFSCFVGVVHYGYGLLCYVGGYLLYAFFKAKVVFYFVFATFAVHLGRSCYYKCL